MGLINKFNQRTPVKLFFFFFQGVTCCHWLIWDGMTCVYVCWYSFHSTLLYFYSFFFFFFQLLIQIRMFMCWGCVWAVIAKTSEWVWIGDCTSYQFCCCCTNWDPRIRNSVIFWCLLRNLAKLIFLFFLMFPFCYFLFRYSWNLSLFK